MLSVDPYELIRRKHLVDGLSIRAINRELGHSRKTIRKALAHETPPGYQRWSLSMVTGRGKPGLDKTVDDFIIGILFCQ